MSQDFNPRPPWGGRLPCADPRPANLLFQSTPSVGRATKLVWFLLELTRISIHALRGEGDNNARRISQEFFYFNPRPPWGGRRRRAYKRKSCQNISIHALRGEGDVSESYVDGYPKISIHALRGEGDYALRRSILSDQSFQSTPSVGRATRTGWQNWYVCCDFNPRPPWGGRRSSLVLNWTVQAEISIHALRGEGDISTNIIVCKVNDISIHALRGEGDTVTKNSKQINNNFNPRPPWGGRPELILSAMRLVVFQSTPSVGRATTIKVMWHGTKVFQSTPSVGRATLFPSSSQYL